MRMRFIAYDIIDDEMKFMENFYIISPYAIFTLDVRRFSELICPDRVLCHFENSIVCACTSIFRKRVSFTLCKIHECTLK